MANWTKFHFNAIAKEIRELFPTDFDFGSSEAVAIMSRHVLNEQRAVLTTLALNLAKRFKEDNPLFDPLKFLDACSPDVEAYPLSELWGEDE